MNLSFEGLQGLSIPELCAAAGGKVLE